MAKFAILFVAALVFTATWAAPKKTQQAASKNAIDEVVQQVQTVANDISTSLQNVLPDSKQVTQDLTRVSQEFATNVQNILGKVSVEIDKHKDSRNDAIQQISGKISETLTSLQQAIGPDASAKATELKTQLDNNVKTISAEFEKLGKVVRENVQPNLQQAGDSVGNFAKTVLDDFVTTAQNLNNQIQHAIQGQKGQKPK